MGLPRWFNSKESACQCRRHGFNSWVRKISWRRNWQPTPVILPGNSIKRGARQATVNGVAESDMTEHACACIHTQSPVSLLCITQGSFTALKIPCSIHSSLPSTPGHHGSSHCLHSFAFSKKSNSWNHTVCSPFSLASFT